MHKSVKLVKASWNSSKVHLENQGFFGLFEYFLGVGGFRLFWFLRIWEEYFGVFFHVGFLFGGFVFCLGLLVGFL